MKTLTINWLAVIACIVIAQLIPAAWYGLFAQKWMTFSGITENQANAAGTLPYLISLIGSALTATFMAIIFRSLSVKSADRGALWGAGFGFFYSFVDLSTINAFELRPFELSLIDGGHIVLVYAVMGTILGGWRKYTQVKEPEKSRVNY